MIRFEENICTNPTEASSREWLETNGIGGFASSTISGIHTRRYHGLLTAALKPPVSRFVLVSKIEETLVIRGRRFDLSANRFPQAIHPQGFVHLMEFRLDPFPVFFYNVDGIQLRKSIFMVHGQNTTVVDYELPSFYEECYLELRPLLAFRDYHSLTAENGWFNGSYRNEPGCTSIQPYEGLPALHLAHFADRIDSSGYWYKNFEYSIEQERGLDFREDLFQPFVLVFDLAKRRRISVIASLDKHQAERAGEYKATERKRREKLIGKFDPDSMEAQISAACDQFIVARGEHKTVIAGYPWFTDWGRDTMISLPGLTLSTGRPDVTRDILLSFARHVDQGMLPNRFPDSGETAEYNTVDATLWFFEAVRAFLQYTGEDTFVRNHLYAALKDIVQWHIGGTRYGIHVDEDGMLMAGNRSTQLTWMDVKIGDWAVTPRHGKPVEIQALWYNALRFLTDLAERFGDKNDCSELRKMAHKTKRSFNDSFWYEEGGYLYDVISEDRPDSTIRPNQIFAVSLHYSMLPAARASKVVETVQRELLTPFGLRSLAPGSPDYRPSYEGDGRTRDSAYHQGTVWPWLIGPFLSAYLKVNRNTKASMTQASEWLQPLRKHLNEAGLGQISEIFDADPPHAPRGCMAQAWSVAEILRVIVDEKLLQADTVASLL